MKFCSWSRTYYCQLVCFPDRNVSNKQTIVKSRGTKKEKNNKIKKAEVLLCTMMIRCQFICQVQLDLKLNSYFTLWAATPTYTICTETSSLHDDVRICVNFCTFYGAISRLASCVQKTTENAFNSVHRKSSSLLLWYLKNGKLTEQ